MKKILLFTSCLVAMLLFAAYQNPMATPQKNHFVAKAHFDRVQVGQKNSARAIERYAYQLMPKSKLAQVTLELEEMKEGSTGYHYRYQPYFNGLPVYRSYIQVNVNWGGEIWSATELTFDFDKVNQKPAPLAKSVQALEGISSNFLQERQMVLEGEMIPVVYFNSLSEAVVGLQVRGLNEESHEFMEYVLDLKGNVLSEQGLNRHYHAPKKDKGHSHGHGARIASLEEATAYVFIPDPVTSAEAVYGLNGGFRDKGDEDSPELTDERKEVTIEVTFENGVYRLENQGISFGELDPRVIPPVTSTEPVFDFTRTEEAFEDVNAFYHLTTYRDYLRGLGSFESSCGFAVDISPIDYMKVVVDAHCFENQDGSFDDQSMFQFIGNQYNLFFGEGGVDDAEDADVIVHEYMHAISHAYCEFCNYGYERLALDEAIGDYFAVSYSRSISEHNWWQMFSWDGHNEFFVGRTANEDKLYPDDMNFLAETPQNEVNEAFIYPDSEIFTAVIMEIWQLLGREDADKLMLASLATFTGDIKFSDAAELLAGTYAQLCGDERMDGVNTLLSLRGLIDFSLNAGLDRTICLGDTVTLGQNLVVSNDLEVFWSPGESFFDSLQRTVTGTPDFSGYYYLNVRNEETGFLLRDSLFITVDYCFDGDPGIRIELLNTDRFYRGRGNAIVEVPVGTEHTTIEVFDILGRVVGQYHAEGDTRIELVQDNLLPGVYLIRVNADDREAVFKVERVR